MILAQGGNEYLVIVAVLAVVCALLLISTRRRLQRRQPDTRGYAREQQTKLRSEQAIKHNMEDLLAELQELARHINSQIDTRFAKLEACIADADQRIERMERLLKRAAGVKGVDVTIDEQTEDDRSTMRQEPPAPVQIDPVHQQIYTLADAGNSAIEIARQLSRTTGEIELILNLRRSKGE